MPHRRAMTRRTAIGGASVAGLAGLLLTGCDLDPRSVPTPQQPTRPADADGPLVEELVAAIRDLAATVEEARRRQPRIAERLRPLADLHAAHLAVLDPGGEGAAASATATAPRARPAATLRRIGTLERRAQRRLAEAAVEAASGDLARVLAAMSAGIAQQLAVGALGAEAPR